MDLKKLYQERHDILSVMEQEFTKEFVPAKLTDKDDYDVEVLAVILEEVAVDGLTSTGEFFFLPNKEDEELQFFVNLITISEELPKETMGELCAAVAAINTYVMTGAFAIDPVAGSLIYKHVYEMPIDLEKDSVAGYVDMSMGTTIQMVQQYAYYLIDVKEGKRTAENVVRALAVTE